MDTDSQAYLERASFMVKDTMRQLDGFISHADVLAHKQQVSEHICALLTDLTSDSWRWPQRQAGVRKDEPTLRPYSTRS